MGLSLIDLLVNDAKEEGFIEGFIEGFEEGFIEGFIERFEEEKKECVVNYMIQNDFSKEEINKITSLFLS